MKFNIKSSVDWNWLFYCSFVFYDFRQPIPVWRQTRPCVIFTYVISGPLAQVGMVQGDPNIIFSLFYASLCIKPGAELILASMIFARRENCFSLGLYFLFSFLMDDICSDSGPHVTQVACKKMCDSFPHNLQLHQGICQAWWLMHNKNFAMWLQLAWLFDTKCQTRITRNNTSNVSVTLSHCDSDCAAVLSEIRSPVSLWFARRAALPTWFVFLHLLLACSVTFSRLFFLHFLFYF